MKQEDDNEHEMGGSRIMAGDSDRGGRESGCGGVGRGAGAVVHHARFPGAWVPGITISPLWVRNIVGKAGSGRSPFEEVP